MNGGVDVRRIRIVVADDERLVRTGLRVVLEAEPDLSVVGEAASGDEVVPMVRELRPDVVLMDVRMPRVDGIRATEQLVAALDPAPRILVVTTFEHDDYVHQALRAGAAGFLLKRSRPEEMVHAVRLAAHGESLLFPPAVRASVATSGGTPDRRIARLTEREREVLRLMAAGFSNGEIAERLLIGAETVKSHVAGVLAKLGARDRTQAVIAAYRSGFVPPN